MKKTVFTLLATVVATSVFFSCTVKETIQSVERTGYEYHFEIIEGETRASLGDEGVFWGSGDQVGIFVGDGSSRTANVNLETTPKSIDLSVEAPLAEGTVIHAYYPYQDGNLIASAAKIVFPHAQSGGSVSAMPLAGLPFEVQDGEVTNGSVFFLNLGSIVDFRVYSNLYAGEHIQSITLDVASGSVSGNATLDLTAVSRTDEGYQIPDLVWTEGNSSVTLTQEASVVQTQEAASESHLYMVVAPGTYSGAISIVTDAAVYSFPFTNVTFRRNTVKRINANLESTNAMRGGIYSIENDKVKAYFDLVETNPYDPADYSYTFMTQDLYGGNTNQTNRLDWPKPVPVSWSNPVSGNADKMVIIYNDIAMNQEELRVSVNGTSTTSAQVYNLIPNRTYYYKVTNGGEFLTKGTFRTTGRRRMIKVGSDYGQGYANNCRDFGGQITHDGRRIKYGKMFRGSNMDLVFPPSDREGNNHPEAKDVIQNYMKIGLDVDLRKSTTSSSNIGKGNNYLYDALQLGDWHTSKSFNSWSDLSSKTNVTDILSKVFDAVNPNSGNRNVYIHCMVGADRTGYICMLLEALLGVDQGWCDVDYELTSFSGAVSGGTPRTRTGTGNYYYFTTTTTNWGHTTTTIQGVDFINTFNGSTFQEKAINYVVGELGFRRSDITAFQNNMLEANN